MTAVGVWLAITGLCDLLRAGRDATPAGRRALLTVGGVLLLVLAVLWLEVPWWLALLWLVTFGAWLQGSVSALVGHGVLARSGAIDQGVLPLSLVLRDDVDGYIGAQCGRGCLSIDDSRGHITVALVSSASPSFSLRRIWIARISTIGEKSMPPKSGMTLRIGR